MSNIIATLKKIEDEIITYADAAGKSIEQIGEEVIEFLSGKTQEAVKANPAGAAGDDAQVSSGTTGTAA